MLSYVPAVHDQNTSSAAKDGEESKDLLGNSMRSPAQLAPPKPALSASPCTPTGSGVMTTGEFYRRCATATPSPVWSWTVNTDDDAAKEENENKESLHLAEDIESELPPTGEYPRPPSGETMADLASDSELEEQLWGSLHRQDQQEHDEMRMRESANTNMNGGFACPNCRTPGDAPEAHSLIDCPQPACCLVCLSKEHLQKDCPVRIPTDLGSASTGSASSDIVPWTAKEEEIEAAFIESIRQNQQNVVEMGGSSASTEKGPDESQ